MPLEEPRWWYRDSPGAAARMLAPVGRLYGDLAVRRFRTTTPATCPLPVICVGNFTLGGTGKTPLALAIADLLEELGRPVWFLTRGYGGRLAGPHRVTLGRDTAADVGDEALLLARRGPTMVARDRPAGAASIVASAAPEAVVVMDDGMQNPSLAKALTLAVVDGRRGIGNGLVFPAGPLRAPLAFQLALADAIVFNLSPLVSAQPPLLDVLRRSYQGPVLTVRTEPTDDLTWLAGQRVVAYAGIGNPQRFFRLIEGSGATVIATRAFADHHRFTDREASALLAIADRDAASLLTTAKDLVRLDGAQGALAELRQASRAIEIRLGLDPRERDRLKALVAGAIGISPTAVPPTDG